MAGTDMAPSFVYRDDQSPAWKRAPRPPRLELPRSPLRRRAVDSDADSDSSADEAAPARRVRKRTGNKARQATAPGVVPPPAGDEIETILDVSDGESSGPDSPDSPNSPSSRPPQLPPPAAPTQPQVINPSPEPPPAVVNPTPTPPPPAPPSPTRPPPAPPIQSTPPPARIPIADVPPITLTPIAPPRQTPRPAPILDANPIRQPSLPVNDVPEQPPPVAAPVFPSSVETTISPSFPRITSAPNGFPDFVPPPTTRTTTSQSLIIDPPRKELGTPSPVAPTDGPFFRTTTSSSTSSDEIEATALPMEESMRGRMDANTEHALIAVGSIGSFIFACFIFFMIWWSLRKAKLKRRERQSQIAIYGPPPPRGPGLRARVVGGVPGLKRFAKARGWETLDETGQQGAFGGEKMTPRGTLQLDTNFYANQQQMAYQSGLVTQGLPQMSLRGSPITASPTGTMGLGRSNTVTAQHGTYQPTENGTIASILGNYAAGTNNTQAFYGQQQRNPNRASEISSLSSGFGDGDIMMPSAMSTLQAPPAVSQGLRSSQNNVVRDSWASRPNRETVYTETSEDLPPRFRTVDSWVNQQTGRVKRAQARSEDDVPPVPGLPNAVGVNNMPPEPQFTMMMPDGEEPRRADGYNNTN